MNFTQLRYFTIVARSGGIRAASELLRVAASAVSRQIQQLEHQVGRPLFERHTRRMRLTEAGEIYAQHAMDVERTRSGRGCSLPTLPTSRARYCGEILWRRWSANSRY